MTSEALLIVPDFIKVFVFAFFYVGGAGVVVFFLVSGYIITHVLQTEHPIEFFVKRIFRIYPLYVAAVLLEAVSIYYMEGTGPDLKIIIPQLLLIGDFFSTPYSLGGVEWTLRIEIIFYVFIGILRCLNVVDGHKKALPWILIFSTLLLGVLAPPPFVDVFLRGFVSINCPFLFLGVFFYLKEVKQISLITLLGFTLMVLYQYYYLFSIYQPNFERWHFAEAGIIAFSLLWRFQVKLPAASAVSFFSGLTYSIYLFHKWAWDLIEAVLSQISIPLIHLNIQVFFILLLLCWLMSRLVERPGIKLGRVVLKRFQKEQFTGALNAV